MRPFRGPAATNPKYSVDYAAAGARTAPKAVKKGATPGSAAAARPATKLARLSAGAGAAAAPKSPGGYLAKKPAGAAGAPASPSRYSARLTPAAAASASDPAARMQAGRRVAEYGPPSPSGTRGASAGDGTDARQLRQLRDQIAQLQEDVRFQAERIDRLEDDLAAERADAHRLRQMVDRSGRPGADMSRVLERLERLEAGGARPAAAAATAVPAAGTRGHPPAKYAAVGSRYKAAAASKAVSKYAAGGTAAASRRPASLASTGASKYSSTGGSKYGGGAPAAGRPNGRPATKAWGKGSDTEQTLRSLGAQVVGDRQIDASEWLQDQFPWQGDVDALLESLPLRDQPSAFAAGAINAIMAGRHVFVRPALGAGALYEVFVPPLLLDGVTLVVVPHDTVSMDYTLTLLDMGIDADAVSSVDTPAEVDELGDALAQSPEGLPFKLLFVTAEIAATAAFAGVLDQLPTVDRVVFLEAHCLSPASHQTLPDYAKVARAVAARLAGVPLVMVSESSTRKTIADILERTKLSDVVVFKADRARDTPVSHLAAALEDPAQIVDFVLDNYADQPGLVLCQDEAECDDLADALADALQAPVVSYHMLKSQEDNIEGYGLWKSREALILVAVPEILAGIHTPQLVFTIHTYVPQTLPAYLQAASRAGPGGVSTLFVDAAQARRSASGARLSAEPTEFGLGELRKAIWPAEEPGVGEEADGGDSLALVTVESENASTAAVLDELRALARQLAAKKKARGNVRTTLPADALLELAKALPRTQDEVAQFVGPAIAREHGTLIIEAVERVLGL